MSSDTSVTPKRKPELCIELVVATFINVYKTPNSKKYDQRASRQLLSTCDVDVVSFFDRCMANVHREERLAAYKADIKAKANLTLVCRAWSVIAQDILYKFVWISNGREGRALAEGLCGAGVSSMGTRAVVTVGCDGQQQA